MKTNLLTSSLALFAAALISSASAADTTIPAERPPYAVTVSGATVALLPAGKDNPMAVTSDSATHDMATGIVTFTGNVKIVITPPNKTPITISGNEVALVPQK